MASESIAQMFEDSGMKYFYIKKGSSVVCDATMDAGYLNSLNSKSSQVTYLERSFDPFTTRIL